MIKKTIKYNDYDGNERVEDFYFNLNKAELIEMELSEEGGLKNTIDKIVNEKNNKKIVELFKTIVLKSYGVKSADGKRFEKSEAILNDFISCEAYSELFVELLSSTESITEFMNGITSNIGNVKAAVPTNR